MTKIKFGMVGLHFGRSVLEDQIVTGPGEPYFEAAAVCDLRRNVVYEVAQKYGLRGHYTFDDMLADKEIQVIGLFTGPAGRAGLIQRIVRAGKDIMTTKPLELDPGAALAALREAQSLGRTVHMNSPAPLPAADLQQIMSWQQTYKLGRTIAARWETWVKYNEQPDSSWYDDPKLCPAAPLFRLGIYGLNDVCGILGEPATVYVTQSRIFTGRPTSDNAQMSITFKDGSLATLFASFCVNDGMIYPDNLVVNFENGTVYRTQELGGREKVGMRLVMRGESGSHEVENIVLDHLYCSGSYQWQNLYRAVSGEKLEGELTPEQNVRSIRVINAMLRSQESGQAEKV